MQNFLFDKINFMSDNIREEKLEQTFLQFIQLVSAMRYRQKYFKENYGSANRVLMEAAQEKVDNVLETMNIPTGINVNLKKCRITFVKVSETDEDN